MCLSKIWKCGYIWHLVSCCRNLSYNNFTKLPQLSEILSNKLPTKLVVLDISGLNIIGGPFPIGTTFQSMLLEQLWVPFLSPISHRNVVYGCQTHDWGSRLLIKRFYICLLEIFTKWNRILNEENIITKKNVHILLFMYLCLKHFQFIK
jgi:hypothetical protein